MADEITGQPAVAAPAEVKTEVKTETAQVKDSTQEKPLVKDTVKATVLEGATEKVEKEIPHDWPDDWREKMAGGDDKFLKRLQRMKSPMDVANWGRNAEKQWKQGADPDPFPSEGTDEEKAAWRKGRSIPSDAKDYLKDFSLPDGLVIGENDKPIVDEYLATAHEMNLPPDVVKNNIGWYFKMRDGQIQQRTEQDEKDKVSTAEELKAEYGTDFKKYVGAAYSLLETAPEGVLGALSEARMADGTKLGNHPQIIRWLSQMALEINPAATVVPGSGAGSLASIDSEIGEIEQLLKTNRDAYWGNEAKQARYRELLEAKDRLKKRNAA